MKEKKKSLITLPLILLCDFDGTLAENAYPGIGEPVVSEIDGRTIIDKVLELRERGWYLILWTCRQGKTLEEAIEWCAEHGLVFDRINDEHPDAHAAFGFDDPATFTPSRKVFGNLTLDDRVVNVRDF